MSGPAGTGKSRACLEKLHQMALLNPGMRGLIIRKTATSLTSTALVTWKTHVIAEALLTGVVAYYGGSAQEPAQYRYENGSLIMVGGMDRSTRIMSSEYDVVYVQEATELTENDWEMLTTRLRNNKISFQQILADCNPDTPTHWLKTRSDAGKTRMLESRHEDNPVLFVQGKITDVGTDYISKLDSLSGARRERLRYGKWVTTDGAIYEEFDTTKHMVDKFKIPDDWARYWSIDFGFVNPFVCQLWAEDPDGRLYLYREIYRTQQTVDQHAEHILKIVAPGNKWREPKPSAIITDHDAEGRVVLERVLGLTTTAANKKVLDGIQAVQKRLRDVDGKPRLMLFRDARVGLDPLLVDAKKPTCTADELPGYVWDDVKAKEQPKKEDDHGCDALRYMVAHRDLGAEYRVRWL